MIAIKTNKGVKKTGAVNALPPGRASTKHTSLIWAAKNHDETK